MDCGISYHDFFHMPLGAVKRQIQAHCKRKEEEWKKLEYHAWLTGYFNMYSIGTNMSKKVKYPKNPLEDEKVIDDEIEWTEDEKEHYREEFLKRLQRMEKRFKKEKR